MTTSIVPSGFGRQYPLSACIGSPEAAFHVLCEYAITGCIHSHPNSGYYDIHMFHIVETFEGAQRLL